MEERGESGSNDPREKVKDLALCVFHRSSPEFLRKCGRGLNAFRIGRKAYNGEKANKMGIRLSSPRKRQWGNRITKLRKGMRRGKGKG